MNIYISFVSVKFILFFKKNILNSSTINDKDKVKMRDSNESGKSIH